MCARGDTYMHASVACTGNFDNWKSRFTWLRSDDMFCASINRRDRTVEIGIVHGMARGRMMGKTPCPQRVHALYDCAVRVRSQPLTHWCLNKTERRGADGRVRVIVGCLLLSRLVVANFVGWQLFAVSRASSLHHCVKHS